MPTLFTLALMGASIALIFSTYENTVLEDKFPFDIQMYSADAEDDFREERALLDARGAGYDNQVIRSVVSVLRKGIRHNTCTGKNPLPQRISDLKLLSRLLYILIQPGFDLQHLPGTGNADSGDEISVGFNDLSAVLYRIGICLCCHDSVEGCLIYA